MVNPVGFIADLIRHITDPEHKHMSLEQLMVVSAPQCSISNASNRIAIEFTPTVPHCGMSTVIGELFHLDCLRLMLNHLQV